MSLEQRLELAFRKAVEDSLDFAQKRIEDNARPISETIAFTLFQIPVEPVSSVLHYRGEIRSPYFWSTILEKGARRLEKDDETWFAFFNDPLGQDPRLRGDYHRTYQAAQEADLRNEMSQEEFRRLADAGVIRFSKTREAIPAGRFMEKAMERTATDLKKRVKAAIRRSVKAEVRAGYKVGRARAVF